MLRKGEGAEKVKAKLKRAEKYRRDDGPGAKLTSKNLNKNYTGPRIPVLPDTVKLEVDGDKTRLVVKDGYRPFPDPSAAATALNAQEIVPTEIIAYEFETNSSNPSPQLFEGMALQVVPRTSSSTRSAPMFLLSSPRTTEPASGSPRTRPTGTGSTTSPTTLEMPRHKRAAVMETTTVRGATPTPTM